MACSVCGSESSATAKFCPRCGAALVAACPGCSHPNPPDSHFCEQCGAVLAASGAAARSPREYTPLPLVERILAGRAAMEGERKQVTVLSADLAGFTSISSPLDPEEVYAFMRRCFDLMLEEVHRYEGTVTQFLGDGILALFGAPLAHEDHAQRAVHASLGIQRALAAYQVELRAERGIELQLRIGLNSGLVVVGTIGTDLNMTYTALGDTVNMAARIQALAAPGTVALSENTCRLVRDHFETRDLGEHAVKGKKAAVRAFEALRAGPARSRVEIAMARGAGRFVGREPELQALMEYFRSTSEEIGQAVLLRGEPGIGKSRLLYEFRRRLACEEEKTRWWEGRCISFGATVAYGAIVDLLKNALGIDEGDSEEEVLRKTDAVMVALHTRDAEVAPFLKLVLAVDPGDPGLAVMDPQMRRIRTFEALTALLAAAAADRPLVVVIEDLHWIDPLSEEYLERLAVGLPRGLLLLLTCRPEYAGRGGTEGRLVQLHLERFSEPEAAAVAAGVLGVQDLPEALRQLLWRKAEGNPFFAEEVVRSLRETGILRPDEERSRYLLERPVEQILVPDTVQDVIMARVDRLPEAPRHALQTASVIGREFVVRLLRRAVDLHGELQAYLDELRALEMILEQAASPELAYMFTHALTHEVAYGSLLLARRKALHRVVGEAIGELYHNRLEEHFEILAHHYERAELHEKALEYLVKSASKSVAAFSPRQAVAFCDRALAAMEKIGKPSPARRIAVHLNRGLALQQMNEWDASIGSLSLMLAAARESGDRTHEAVALSHIGLSNEFAHRFEAAVEYSTRASQLARETGNDLALATSLFTLSSVHQVSGHLDEGRALALEMRELGRRAALPFFEGCAAYTLGYIEHWQGNGALAIQESKEAIRIGREQQNAQLLLLSLFGVVLATNGHGEYGQALRWVDELLELCVRLGDFFWRPRACNVRTGLYMDLCYWDRALESDSEAAAAARVLGDPETARNSAINLGNCYLALGRLNDAQRILEAVETETQRPASWGEDWMKWRYSQYLAASLGDLWLARGEPERALRFADTCLAGAIPTGSRRNIVKARRLRGEGFTALGRHDEGAAELDEALRVAREVGNPAQLWKTLAAFGRLAAARSRDAESVAMHREALAILEGMAAGLTNPELRATLLASHEAEALRQAACHSASPTLTPRS
jgi:class 3 adenylate cyclase/tetratricopeptide (TPR) repeat protein